MGLSGERGGPQGVAATPPHGSPNWTRGRGGAPLSLSLSLSFPLSPSRKGKGVQLGLGILVGLPLMARPLGRRHSPSPPLYTWAGGQGAPQRGISYSLSHVRC